MAQRHAIRNWLVSHPALLVLPAYLAAAVALDWRLCTELGFTSRTVACLDALWQGPASINGCALAFAFALSYWHPAAVVADTGPGTPLGQFLITCLGKPAIQDGQLLAWRSALAVPPGLAAVVVGLRASSPEHFLTSKLGY